MTFTFDIFLFPFVLYLYVHAVWFEQALECLVRLASVRRSIFVEDPARSQFLSHLMSGTKEILQTGQGLPRLTIFVKLVLNTVDDLSLSP
jgi:hypothetical protein